VRDSEQPSLFGDDEADDGTDSASVSALPEGFRYEPRFISADAERALIGQIERLPFKEFEFHGFTGKRRVISFGWRYDFGGRELQKADDIPQFLMPLRAAAAAFAGLARDALQHVLLTEYSAGAAIGWHRDKAVFGEVVGVSLLAPCRFRFRRRRSDGRWQRAALTAAPRSAYLLAGPARTEWEHSIPPVQSLRYSITFRNFAARSPVGVPAY
jgi:alkylated DNA repair dioxygenase AlkB